MAAAAAERRAILVAEDADSEVTQLLRQSGCRARDLARRRARRLQRALAHSRGLLAGGEVALQSGGKLAAHFELAAGVGCIVITATSVGGVDAVPLSGAR
jgi:hypothetical protein